MRLDGKTAVIFGTGQAPTSGDIIGNGRATALTFGREESRCCASTGTWPQLRKPPG
jgi:hypothetical protein